MGGLEAIAILPITMLAGSGSLGSEGVNFTQLAQYGILGLVTLALIFGRIVPWSYYDEKKAEIIRLQAELAEERKNFEDLRKSKDIEIATLRTASEERIIPLAVRLLDIIERRGLPRERGDDR